MRTSLGILVLGCGGMWLVWTATAAAENLTNVGPSVYASPAVSPYLNLGVTPNGITNYQTLVRPLIEEREALSRQAMNIQKLQQQVGNNRAIQTVNDAKGKDPKSRSGSTVRFMDYSHYFNRLP